MNEDMLVTFRRLSGEWADRARAEARAALAAFEAGAGGATEVTERLILIVEEIHANCVRTLDGLQAALTNNSLVTEPDDLAQTGFSVFEFPTVHGRDGACGRRLVNDAGG